MRPTITQSKLACFLVFILFLSLIGASNGQVTFQHNFEIATEFANYPNSAAWGDIDNDGDLDAYMAVGSNVGFDIMLNDLSNSGIFLKADTLSGHFVRTAGPRSVLIADIENDGDLDLLAVGQDYQIWLILNQLVETDSLWFLDVSEETGIAHIEEAYYGASMADYDNDGKLDIFVGGLSENGWYPSLLFRNTTPEGGPVAFEELADFAGILSEMGMNMNLGAWGDYDDDGDQDVFVTTMGAWPEFLYRNEGNGTFTDVTLDIGLENAIGNSRAAVWGDYDNDGDLDIFIGRRTYTDMPNMDICQMYSNDGGVFSEIVSAQIVGEVIYGVAAGDYDNDGDLDLHLLDSDGPDFMLQNEGEFQFTDVTSEVKLLKAASGSGWGDLDIQDRGGQTWIDWDADGDLDLLLPSQSGLKPYLMRNDGGNANNWLEIKLTGIQSNRSAVGVRVIAVSSDLRQIREVCMGTGYIAGPPTDIHFGFGQRTVIDSLIIRWPSGTIDGFVDVDVNQILHITEGSHPVAVNQIPEIPNKFALAQNYPNPFNPRTKISYVLPKPGYVHLEVFSILGQHIISLVDEYQIAGEYKVNFDAGKMAAGVYIYRIKVDGFTQQKKMLFLR